MKGHVVICSNDSEISYSQVILLNILWQSHPEYLYPLEEQPTRKIKKYDNILEGPPNFSCECHHLGDCMEWWIEFQWKRLRRLPQQLYLVYPIKHHYQLVLVFLLKKFLIFCCSDSSFL